MDVGVGAGDVLPIREVEPGGFERVAQFQQRVGAAHLFEGQHVGLEREDALADFGLGFGGFGVAGLGGFVEVVFDVVGGDAEGFGAGDQRGRPAARARMHRAGRGGRRFHAAARNSGPAGRKSKGICGKRFCKTGVRCYLCDMFKPSENGSARSRRHAAKRAGQICGADAVTQGNGAPAPRGQGQRQLHDKQSERDHRELRIDKVGVRGLRFPIQVRDKAHAVQNTVATIGMFVDLPKEFKGTHMSRFIEVLNAHGNIIHVENITGHPLRDAGEVPRRHVAPGDRVPVFHGEAGAGHRQGKRDGLRRAVRRGGLPQRNCFRADGQSEGDDALPVLEGHRRLRRAQPARRGDRADPVAQGRCGSRT